MSTRRIHLAHYFLGLISLCMLSLETNAQKATLSGSVRSESGEALVAANVWVLPLKQGTTTNDYGYFALSLPASTYTVVVTYLGYAPDTLKINLKQNTQHNFRLKSAAVNREEIVVEGRRADENTREAGMGRAEVNIEQVKSLPALLGEADILRTIQLLPGIQKGGEGNTGFYVRGGGPDQNLILLDEAVVYNASHLFGFFSVFNADAINNTTLIKGGMPPQYGGRVSSVLAIGMREGNNQRFETQGGIGLIASRLTTEGPLKRDKGSFIISGRRTYIDVLVNPLIPPDAVAKGSGYFFYDFNTKLNYQINAKNRIFASGYFGRDVFTFKNQEIGLGFNIPWGNATGTLRWNHIFGPRLFLNTTLIYSDFDFATEVTQSQFQFKLNSGVRNKSLKLDADYYASLRHRLKVGAQYTKHGFTPSVVEASTGENTFGTPGLRQLNAHELALYAQDVWDISDALQIQGGIRWSGYRQMGPYLYQRYTSTELLDLVEEVAYKENEKVVDYGGFEPRLLLRLSTSRHSSVKLGITRNLQYIHLASSSGNALPTDLWVPSTRKVRPQEGIQYALGYFLNDRKNQWEASVEVYYKTLQNQIDFRDGAVDGFNLNIENDFVFGFGRSYGAEWYIKKRTGALTGWLGYTWSKSDRRFDDIMQGRWFPYKFDRRHDVSFVASYERNKKWTFSTTFVYATGNAYTLPESRYFFEGQIINQIGDRNNFRFAPYHRLDLAAVYKPLRNQGRKWQNEWVFAIYNVYSRLNPYFVYLNNTGSLQQQSLRVEARQVSLFPIIPSVTYNFKF